MTAAIKHGPCVECGAPVTVRDDGREGILLCLECAERPNMLGVAMAIALLVGGAVLVIWAAVTP